MFTFRSHFVFQEESEVSRQALTKTAKKEHTEPLHQEETLAKLPGLAGVPVSPGCGPQCPSRCAEHWEPHLVPGLFHFGGGTALETGFLHGNKIL